MTSDLRSRCSVSDFGRQEGDGDRQGLQMFLVCDRLSLGRTGEIFQRSWVGYMLVTNINIHSFWKKDKKGAAADHPVLKGKGLCCWTCDHWAPGNWGPNLPLTAGALSAVEKTEGKGESREAMERTLGLSRTQNKGQCWGKVANWLPEMSWKTLAKHPTSQWNARKGGYDVMKRRPSNQSTDTPRLGAGFRLVASC